MTVGGVSILVFMEVPQGRYTWASQWGVDIVSILVFMEVPQGLMIIHSI